MKVDETGAQRVALGTATDGGAVVPVGPANPLPMGGNVNSGSADSGAPLKIGGVVNSGTPAASADGTRKDLWVSNAGAPVISLAGNNPADALPNTVIGFFTQPGGGGGIPAAAGYLFNGATWDRQRGDTSGLYIAGATYWTEATANQAAAATLNGTLRSAGGVAGGIGSRFNWFVAEVFSDQAGTLYVDKSTDGGATWRQVGSIAAVAGTSVSLRVPISGTAYRARFVNGATATTAFLLTTSFAR